MTICTDICCIALLMYFLNRMKSIAEYKYLQDFPVHYMYTLYHVINIEFANYLKYLILQKDAAFGKICKNITNYSNVLQSGSDKGMIKVVVMFIRIMNMTLENICCQYTQSFTMPLFFPKFCRLPADELLKTMKFCVDYLSEPARDTNRSVIMSTDYASMKSAQNTLHLMNVFRDYLLVYFLPNIRNNETITTLGSTPPIIMDRTILCKEFSNLIADIYTIPNALCDTEVSFIDNVVASRIQTVGTNYLFDNSNLIDIEADEEYPPPIHKRTRTMSGMKIFPMIKVYTSIMKLTNSKQQKRINNEFWSAARMMIMTKEEFGHLLLNNFYGAQLQTDFTTKEPMGRNKIEIQNNPFTRVVTHFLWIAHCYVVTNWLHHVLAHRRQQSETQLSQKQYERLKNVLPQNKSYSTIEGDIHKELTKQVKYYQQLYSPFINKYKEEQKQARDNLQIFQATEIVTRLKDEEDSLTANRLCHILKYNNMNDQPHIQNQVAMNKVLSQLEITLVYALQQKELTSVQNNNKLITKYTELYDAVQKSIEWYNKHYNRLFGRIPRAPFNIINKPKPSFNIINIQPQSPVVRPNQLIHSKIRPANKPPPKQSTFFKPPPKQSTSHGKPPPVGDVIREIDPHINPYTNDTPSIPISTAHIDEGYPNMIQNMNTGLNQKVVRNSKHLYAIYWKKNRVAGSDQFNNCKVIDYTQNLLNNLQPTKEFQEFMHEYYYGKDNETGNEVLQNKTNLERIVTDPDYAASFDFLEAINVNINDEHQKKMLDYDEKQGLFKSFAITNIFTNKDFQVLKQVFHKFWQNLLWNMNQTKSGRNVEYVNCINICII